MLPPLDLNLEGVGENIDELKRRFLDDIRGKLSFVMKKLLEDLWDL